MVTVFFCRQRAGRQMQSSTVQADTATIGHARFIQQVVATMHFILTLLRNISIGLQVTVTMVELFALFVW